MTVFSKGNGVIILLWWTENLSAVFQEYTTKYPLNLIVNIAKCMMASIYMYMCSCVTLPRRNKQENFQQMIFLLSLKEFHWGSCSSDRLLHQSREV